MQCTGKTTVAKGIIDKFQSPDGEIGNAVSIMLNFVNNFEEKVSVP